MSTGPARRVLVTGINYAPEPTGIAPYTAGMATALAERGWALRVLTTLPHYPQWRVAEDWQDRAGVEQDDGVSVRRFRPRLPSGDALLSRLLFELNFGARSTLRRWHRPDVLLTVSPALFASALSLLRARLARVPSVVWVQDIYSLGAEQTGRGRAAGRLLTALEGRVLRSADRVVVIHERFARHLTSRLGVPADRVVVVRNWSHVAAAPVVDRTAVRTGLGWAPDDVVALHAGNMGAKQGLENVVHAARVAAERRSRVRFVLMGDGNQRAALEAMGSCPNLDIIDPVADADFAPTLAAADVLVVNERAGLTEMSVPSKLTSYFSTGRPVVAATDRSSVTAEEVGRAGAGVRVDAEDPAALLGAVEELARDPERCEAFGRAGRSFREQVLSTDGAVQRFESVLTELVRR